MSIIQLPRAIPGTEGVTPNIKSMEVTDALSVVTTAGYLTFSDLQGAPISQDDEIHVKYNASETNPNQGDLAVCKVTITNGVITLTEDISEGNVILPVTSGDFALYSGTEGKINDVGLKPADVTKKKVVTTQDTTYDPNTLAKFAVNGSIHHDNGDAQNKGNIIAGDSGDGVAGKLVSTPATANKGTLELVAQDNAGNSNIQIKNQSFGSNVDLWLVSTGSSDGYIQISTVPSVATGNSFWLDIAIPVATLNTTGVTIYPAVAGYSFKIRDLMMNIGTNFDAGGDKDVAVSDGTTTYTTIPAASLKAQTNDRWGSTAVPFSGSSAANTTTTVGAAISAAYSGGTTDYTSGTFILSILVDKQT